MSRATARILPGIIAVLTLATATAAAEPDVKAARKSKTERTSAYTQERQGNEEREAFSQRYKVGRDGALDLSNVAGDVRITGGGGSEIRLDAVKRVRHRDSAEAKRLLSLLQIEVSQVGSRVEVRTIYPRRQTTSREGSSGRVDYTLTVPEGIAVTAATVSGDMAVESVAGEVRAQSVSGDVTVLRTRNLVSAKTVSGDVIAREVGAETRLELGTISGDVTAENVKVRALETSTVSGTIQLTQAQLERLDAKSVSGSLAFDGPLRDDGRYTFNAHSGTVRLTIAGDTGFELEASTFSGNIRSDFPVTLRGQGAVDRVGDDRRGPSRNSRSIRGTFGDGSAVVSIRTFSGSVVVGRR